MIDELKTLEYVADECERLERLCRDVSPATGAALLFAAFVAFRRVAARDNPEQTELNQPLATCG